MADHCNKKIKLDALAECIQGGQKELTLSDAIDALQLFIQINFTGPAVDLSAYKDLDREKLSVDGESASRLANMPQLLVAAIEAFERLQHPIWLARALMIQQSLLTNCSGSLHKRVIELYSEANMKDFASSEEEITLLLAELTRAYLLFDDLSKAKETLDLAISQSGLVVAITGIKGKRTKFQQHEISQLVCLAVSKFEDSGVNHAPKALELNSDIFLEKPTLGSQSDGDSSLPKELLNIDPNNQPPLRNVDSVLLLLWGEYLNRNSPADDSLLREQQRCLVDRVIGNSEGSVNWSVYSRALWTRSVLESHSSHTVERGTLQMQALVEELGYGQQNYLSGVDTSDNAGERLELIHSLVPLPHWSMDIVLAERYMSLGVVKAAVEIYERLGLWGDAALCYALVGQEMKGLEVLDNHLAQHPEDARAWCIKGDITVDPQYWEKSWETGRYAPSMRSLGRYYFTPPKDSGYERDLDKAAHYIRESLTINNLSYDAWFTLGCIGIEKEDWESAAKAFTQAVTINDEDTKSWSNLASALLQLQKPQQSLYALRQAIKADKNKDPNWRVWSNLITVAAELNDWDAVVEGINQMLNLRSDKQDKFIDPAVLYEVIFVFISSEYQGTASQESFIELITERLPLVITSDPSLWRLVARVDMWRKRPWDSLTDYEKGFRICTHIPDLETNADSWKEAVNFCSDLVDAYQNLGELPGRIEGSVVCPDWKFKARTAVRSLMSKAKLFWEDSPQYERLQELKAQCA